MDFYFSNDSLSWIESEFVSVRNRGFLLGDGFFTTMLWNQNELLNFNDHYLRLINSSSIFEMQFNINSKDLYRSTVNILTEKQSLRKKTKAIVRITVTRGGHKRGIMPILNEPPNLFLSINDYVEIDEPITLIHSPFEKNTLPPLSQVKHSGYQVQILSRIHAHKIGAQDALLWNWRGHLVSSTFANVFIVLDEKYMTPPLIDGPLPGIIRSKIIKERNASEQNITKKMIESAEKIYLTNSLIDIKEGVLIL